MEQIEDILINIDERRLNENIELHEGFLSSMKKFGKSMSTAGKYVSGILHHKKIGDISKEIYNNKMKDIKDLDASEKQLYADIDFLLSTLSYITNKDGVSYDVEHPKNAIIQFTKDYNNNNFEDEDAQYADNLDNILSSKLRRRIEKLDNADLEQYHLNNKSVFDYLADLQNKGSVNKFIKQFGKNGTDADEITRIKIAIVTLKYVYQKLCTKSAKIANEKYIYDDSKFKSQITIDLQKLISAKENGTTDYTTNDGNRKTLKQAIIDVLNTKSSWQDVDISNSTDDDIIATISKYQKYFVNDLIWQDSKAFGSYFNYVMDKINNSNAVIDFEKAALSYFICSTTEIIAEHHKDKASQDPNIKDTGISEEYAIKREISKIYGQLRQGQPMETVLPKLKNLVSIQPSGFIKGGYSNQILSAFVDDLMTLESISIKADKNEPKEMNN